LIPGNAWPFLAAIGFLGTFLAIQTFYAGSRRIGAAQAALVSTVEPLIIVSLAFVFLHETLAPIQLIGAALIIVGVLVAQTAERPASAAGVSIQP
jgi:drug/metabolite transporter (DMT)-like permease